MVETSIPRPALLFIRAASGSMARQRLCCCTARSGSEGVGWGERGTCVGAGPPRSASPQGEGLSTWGDCEARERCPSREEERSRWVARAPSLGRSPSRALTVPRRSRSRALSRCRGVRGARRAAGAPSGGAGSSQPPAPAPPGRSRRRVGFPGRRKPTRTLEAA